MPGVYRREGRRDLVSQAAEEDLVQRRFDVEASDRLLLTDITGHPTGEREALLRCCHKCLSVPDHRLVRRRTAGF
ncbi:hypothetical protein ACFQYP_63295 [Nonomuraea antimicrobica]